MSEAKEHLENTTEFVSSPDIHSIATRFYLQSLARELLPQWRIGMCMRHKQTRGGVIEVRYSPAQKKAWYAGLFRCGSGWTCAFCAYKISEQRRRELTQALANKIELYTPFLITYTIRHNAQMSLAPTLASMLEAFRQMKKGRDWSLYKGETGMIGSVRGLEITHGLSGWHPHIHELALLKSDVIQSLGSPIDTSLSKPEQKKALSKQWNEGVQAMAEWIETQLGKFYWYPALQKQGLSCSLERGVTVTHTHKAIIEYVAKFGHAPTNPRPENGWGVESELTKANIKRGREGNRTPFQLLADYGAGDKQAGGLFVEYANATFGRSSLQWTPGLKDLLGLTEVSDEQASELEPEVFEILAEIESETWRRILKHDLRARVLEIALSGDCEQVLDFLAEIPD